MREIMLATSAKMTALVCSGRNRGERSQGTRHELQKLISAAMKDAHGMPGAQKIGGRMNWGNPVVNSMVIFCGKADMAVEGEGRGRSQRSEVMMSEVNIRGNGRTVTSEF